MPGRARNAVEGGSHRARTELGRGVQTREIEVLGQVEAEELERGDRRPDRSEDDDTREQRLETGPARNTVGGAERDAGGGAQGQECTICRPDLGGVEPQRSMAEPRSS